MIIEIDPHAGPCPGVKRALRMAEEQLHQGESLVAVGPIIHNRSEMDRLSGLGLTTVDQITVQQGQTQVLQNRSVFIRSHGISKALFQTVEQESKRIVNGTCPVVQKIQQMIAEYHAEGYQIIIVGKPSHPEVLGLNGHCNNQAVLVQQETDIANVDTRKPSVLLSQTTIAQSTFFKMRDLLLQRMPNLIVKDTTCRQVNRRHENIRNFAKRVDVVLLVGGKQSSNTRVLYEKSRECNPNTHWIESAADLEPRWFSPDDHVGITGSASTPIWQLQQIQQCLENGSERSAA